MERNNLIQTIPILHKQWSLSVDIKPTGLVEGWSNVLHVGLGDDVGTYGDRSPGIWFASLDTRLHIPSAINGNHNYYNYGDTPAIPMNEWTNVHVSQVQLSDGSYQFAIRVAGIIFHQMINTNPMTLKNVYVYASDNFYPASLARIDNFVIETFPDDSTG